MLRTLINNDEDGFAPSLLTLIIILMFLVLVFFAFVENAYAEDNNGEDDEDGSASGIQFFTSIEGVQFESFQGIDGVVYLYLPQQKKEKITVTSSLEIAKIIDDNETIELVDKNHFNAPLNHRLIVIDKNERTYDLVVAISGIPCINIILHDVTLEEIHAQSKKERFSNNDMMVFDKNNMDHFESIELKGRGNYNWNAPKKSYQIKLEAKKSLFCMSRAKTWVLLPNGTDSSLIRNKLALDLAREMRINYALDSRFIDLWIDGQYLGNYLFAEKPQINKERIN